MESQERIAHIVEQNVYIAFFLFGLILLGWVMVYDRKKIQLYFSSFFGSRYTEQLERNELDKSGRLIIVSRFFFFSSLAIILYKLENLSYLDTFSSEGIMLWCLIFVSILSWYIIKTIIVNILGWMFGLVELSKESGFYTQLNSMVLGFIMYPILLFSHFQEFASETKFFLLIALLLMFSAIMKSFKLISISFNRFGVSIYYNILYICSLEILPLIVLMKLLIGKI